MDKEKFYITTAIAYASQKPHFGNTYEIILTDAIARYKRQMGYDVFFCTGTDEHGQKIENKANEAGVTPKKFVDGVADEIRGVWDAMNTTYDHFIRTTDDHHERAVQHIFEKFYKQGDIYKGYYEENVTFIEPETKKKEMLNNFIIPGLQDLCVSRTSFKWGIPVPFDNKHVIYVWLDALTNYITALGYDPYNEEQPEKFKKYWPCDVHVIGKDITRFHTIYWPIFLMALGLPLPKKVFVHPWFKFGEDKMSKSRGNVIYADKLAERFSVDGVRYFALSEMPYVNDGSITYESFISRYNMDLANNLGNLVSRTAAMTKKYFGGVIPAPAGEVDPDADLKAVAMDSVKEFRSLMDTYHLADAAECAMLMLRRANKYIDETMPWALAKDESAKERLGTVLYNLLEMIRIGAILLAPIIPETSDKIFAMLKTDARGYDSLEAFGGLEAGHEIGECEMLFSRIDEEKMLAEIPAETAAAKAAAAPEKPEGLAQIGIDDFMKTELRCARVVECEKVPKSKKLLRLVLDLGYERRQVASGIAQYYTPDELIGRNVIVVANLAPAKLCGVESCGMILACGEESPKVVFLDENTKPGERIR